MKQLILNLLYLLFLTLFTGCSLFDNLQIKNGIRSKRVFKNYENEQLFFENYIYFFDEIIYGKRTWIDPFKNQDSALFEVRKSIVKSDLNLVINDSLENLVTKELIQKIGLTFRSSKVKNKWILNFIPDYKTYIIPVINNGISRDFHRSAFYPNSETDFFGWSDYKVVIFIVKNKKVIYKRAVRYWELHTQTGPAITDYRSDVRLEHLGLIVEKAMEDYIKRIKKEE